MDPAWNPALEEGHSVALMKHGRQTRVPHKGKGAAPWKYMLHGKPIRRGKEYFASLYDKDGELIWQGKVLG